MPDAPLNRQQYRAQTRVQDGASDDDLRSCPDCGGENVTVEWVACWLRTPEGWTRLVQTCLSCDWTFEMNFPPGDYEEGLRAQSA